MNLKLEVVRDVTVLDRNSVFIRDEEKLLFYCSRIKMRGRAGKIITVGKR